MGNSQNVGRIVYDACSSGDEAAARQLLDAAAGNTASTQADVVYVDEATGATALHWACYHGKRDLALAVMTRAPSLLFVQTVRGKTPMDYARDEGFYELADLLDTIAAKSRSSAAAGAAKPQARARARSESSSDSSVGAGTSARSSSSGTAIVAKAAAASHARRANTSSRAVAAHNPFDMSTRRRAAPPPLSSSSGATRTANPFDMSSDSTARARAARGGAREGSSSSASTSSSPSPLLRGGARRAPRRAKPQPAARLTRRQQREAQHDRRSETERFRDRLANFYRVHRPDKLGDVGMLVAKYSGKEEELFTSLTRKYGEEEVDYDDAGPGCAGPGYGEGGDGCSSGYSSGYNRPPADTVCLWSFFCLLDLFFCLLILLFAHSILQVGLSRLVGVVFPGVKPAFETVQRPMLQKLVDEGVLTAAEARAQEEHYKRVWTKLRDGV